MDPSEMMAGLKASLKPYQGKLPSYSRIPQVGLSRQTILETLRSLGQSEESRWRDGRVSGAVYHGDA